MRKTVYTLFAVMALATLFAAVHAEAGSGQDAVLRAGSTELTMPDGMSWALSTEENGAWKYLFIYDSRVVMTAYMGDEPGSFEESGGGVDMNALGESTINGMMAVTSKRLDREAGATRDTLIDTGARFPRYIHFFYRDLDSGLGELVDGIIESAETGRPETSTGGAVLVEPAS